MTKNYMTDMEYKETNGTDDDQDDVCYKNSK